MKKIEINLYSFSELCKVAKERAITDHINFEVEIMQEKSLYIDIAKEMDANRTPWFTASEIYHRCKDDIIDTIKANEYLYFKNGEMAYIIRRNSVITGNGLNTTLTLHGETYPIN